MPLIHEVLSCLQGSLSASCPLAVILLRCLSFLVCAFLLALTFSADRQTSNGGLNHSQSIAHNVSATKNGSDGVTQSWQSLLDLLPVTLVEYAKLLWLFGQANQMAVICVGLSSCLIGLLLAGAARLVSLCCGLSVWGEKVNRSSGVIIRLRRIDIVSSVLWFLVCCWHLLASYVEDDTYSWPATHVTTVLCCLFSFAAAVATRNPLSQRRGRYRRSESQGWCTLHDGCCWFCAFFLHLSQNQNHAEMWVPFEWDTK